MSFFKKDERFELHLDHGKLVLVAIGVLLVGALLFLLGMLVGRSFLATPADTAARVDAATAGKVVEAPLEPQPVKKTKKPEYTFYENVDKPEGQGAEPLSSQRPAATGSGAPKKTNTTLIVPRTMKKAATQEVAEPAKKAPEPRLIAPVPPAPKAAPPAKAAAPTKAKTAKAAPKPPELSNAPLNLATVFTIQVGSFQKRAMAEKMAEQIKAKGVSSTVREVKIKGALWYRVQVGEFATKNKARDHYENKLKPKGIKGFILTR